MKYPVKKKSAPYQAPKRAVLPRDFPDVANRRRAVCKRCHCVMADCEPNSPHGEYYHPKVDGTERPYRCPNAGKTFTDRDLEVVPFMRKARRRACKRMKLRP